MQLAVAGIADDNSDAPKPGKRTIHDISSCRRIRHVKRLHDERLRIAVDQIVNFVDAASGSDYAIATESGRFGKHFVDAVDCVQRSWITDVGQ